MTYDTVVIGVGLAGLTAALRLAEQGQRVLVVARGVGSTHLAAGTIDVLGYAPGRVESPERALPDFLAAHPEHPYGRVGPPAIAAAVEWLKARVPSYRYVGGLDENLLLPTAVGAAKPTAVVPETMAPGDLRAGGRFVFVGLRWLKDFYPAYLADNAAHAALPAGASVRARAVELAPPANGEADVSTLAFARRFDDPDFRRAVVAELNGRLEPGEAVGFPATLGLTDPGRAWRELQEALQAPVFEVPTLPPSVPGIRLYRALKDGVRRSGGRVLVSDTVIGAEVARGRVEGVVVETAARPLTYRGRWFVLASGGFASGGLELDSYGRVRETIFDLPVAGVPERREASFGPGYFDSHGLSAAGLAVDERLRPTDRDGRAVYENLYAAGATLAGAVPWREKSGDGVSLATGYAAAAAILERV